MRDLLGLRVLVVEPDRTLAFVLADALTLAGARVVAMCSNLSEAARGRETPQALVVGTRSTGNPEAAARDAQRWGLPFLLTCDRPVSVGDARNARCLTKPFCYHDLVEGLIDCAFAHDAPR
ncbi:hypothetical protein [Thermomonas fusca]|uniref:hypothetical protein n=1 Tax=Thermomonas fusca TaxID=215690 RepID=UPI0012EBF6E4|nr:hypothetical protein [Thermomonas fusca]